MVEPKEIVVLAWMEAGGRHVTNNRGLVRNPEDLKGLRIRVPPDKIRLDTFKTLGAEPGPLSFGELYSSLCSARMIIRLTPPVSPGRTHDGARPGLAAPPHARHTVAGGP